MWYLRTDRTQHIQAKLSINTSERVTPQKRLICHYCEVSQKCSSTEEHRGSESGAREVLTARSASSGRRREGRSAAGGRARASLRGRSASSLGARCRDSSGETRGGSSGASTGSSGTRSGGSGGNYWRSTLVSRVLDIDTGQSDFLGVLTNAVAVALADVGKEGQGRLGLRTAVVGEF